MQADKRGFAATLASYPSTFWVANTMEIFERMAWYGWFALMPLYVTGSVATGGLGFPTELRGALQGIVTFFLYMFPVITGALADRYGYKRMFIIAYIVMMLAYYGLGQFTTIPTFFLAFMFVAVGAAIFKPVVVGTVARITDASNSATAFGIFYMMVNIGGFIGPFLTGQARGEGWNWVFIVCSSMFAINLLIVLLFYQDPPATGTSTGEVKGSLRQVGENMVEVLGNVRFFVTVFVVLFALMFANLDVYWFRHFKWSHCFYFVPVWIVLNLIWDWVMPADSGNPRNTESRRRPFFLKRMHCSNWRFALFLLILSGFWTSFNQIFYTMPEYIRDFVDTRPMIHVAEKIFGEGDPENPDTGFVSRMATINEDERAEIVRKVSALVDQKNEATLDQSALENASKKLLQSKVRLTPDEIKAHLTKLTRISEDQKQATADAVSSLQSAKPAGAKTREQVLEQMPDKINPVVASLKDKGVLLRPHQLATIIANKELSPSEMTDEAITLAEVNPVVNQIVVSGRQVNPEYIGQINAGSIVLFQVLISFLMARFHRFTTMIVGMMIAAVGIGLSALAGTEGMIGQGGLIWIVAGGIFVFSFGEMMASPTSQEYVGRIAPGDKKALYMGYYFVAVGLGNLFGGILSGELLAKLAYDMNRPDLMWLTFGGIMLSTSIVFMLYNRFALPGDSDELQTPQKATP